jgi:SAM-dependent methyltransferase
MCERIKAMDVELSESVGAAYIEVPGDRGKQEARELLILDLGCGPNKYPNAVGVDVFAYEGVDVVCDVFEYVSCLPSKTVDMVVMRQFIEHVDPARLIREVYRILKPRGKILIETPNALQIFRILRAIVGIESIPSADHILVYTARELWNLLHRNGFESIKISHFNSSDSNPVKRLVNWVVKHIFPLFCGQLKCVALKSDVPFSVFSHVRQRSVPSTST